ncbi:MAG: hypothetical protein Q4B28_08745 [bacterium]|nr:hypothetical protein [bacterium]
MKNIILIMLLAFLGISCQKKDNPDYGPVRYKTGILQDKTQNSATLLISFSNQNYLVETVEFQSVWLYEVNGASYQLRLTQRDFVWSYENGALEGRYIHSFREAPTRIVISFIRGSGRIHGCWSSIL